MNFNFVGQFLVGLVTSSLIMLFSLILIASMVTQGFERDTGSPSFLSSTEEEVDAPPLASSHP